jgi:hypothetical protein
MESLRLLNRFSRNPLRFSNDIAIGLPYGMGIIVLLKKVSVLSGNKIAIFHLISIRSVPFGLIG